MSDPAFLKDLEHHLLATECLVEQVGANELEVSVPRAPTKNQARREIEIYLKAWQAINPTVVASFVSRI